MFTRQVVTLDITDLAVAYSSSGLRQNSTRTFHIHTSVHRWHRVTHKNDLSIVKKRVSIFLLITFLKVDHFQVLSPRGLPANSYQVHNKIKTRPHRQHYTKLPCITSSGVARVCKYGGNRWFEGQKSSPAGSGGRAQVGSVRLRNPEALSINEHGIVDVSRH